MKSRLDLGWMASLLRHPRMGNAVLGLLACCAALAGFRLGMLQSELDREQQRLAVLKQRLETVHRSPDEVWGTAGMDEEQVLGGLVDGVEGARAWVRSLRQAAAEAGIVMRLRWGDSARPMSGMPKVEYVQVVIGLDLSSTKHRPASRIKSLLQYLGVEKPPFELSRLHWTGSGHGLTGVVVEGRLWIRRSES